jgi:quercetin dioxygenase-like cupin family protein
MRQTTLQLATDDFTRLHGAARLHVTQGLLWVTIDGEPDDHLLHAGDALALPTHTRALAQALDAPARLTIETRSPWWQALAEAWHAATRREALS